MTLIFLTQEFYDKHSNHKEIAKKELRPYILFVVCYNGMDFGIPFRSNISHPHFYKTSNENKSGIDFTKSVIIFDEKYIDKSKYPKLRDNEYKKVIGKEYYIQKKFIKYIEDYKKSFNKIINNEAHNRDIILCKFSTLQYYHKEIGLNKELINYIN